MPSVEEEAKLCTVDTSPVMVDISVAGLGVVVEAQRKPVQVLVHPDAKVIGHPLADAGGVVIVDVGRLSRR